MGVERKIDLVTVCYWDELRLLALQARSIRLYADPALIGQILLLVNDPDFQGVRRQIEKLILPEYGSFAPAVKILPYRALTAKKFKKVGWRSQQVLKLLVAQVVRTGAYMVLDCKNHFIRSFSKSCVWADNGKILMPINKIVAGFRQDYESACALMDVKPLSLGARTLPSVTPFIFDTQSVLGLISLLEDKESRGFSDIFMQGPRVTEFYLYLAYLQKAYGAIDALYEVAFRRTISLMSGQKNNFPEVENRIEQACQSHMVCFGVHRSLIEENKPDIKAAVTSFWKEAGLISNNEEAQYFWALTPPSRVRRVISLVRKLWA